MTQGPEDPHIPTLTQVIKPAARPRTQDSGPPGTLPPPTEPVVPSPGTLPPDLDIDFSLEALDEPSLSLAPPGLLESLAPATTPATADTAPEPPMRDLEALRAGIEQAVDAALSAQLPQLREQLVRAVMARLTEADETGGHRA
ncbi:hypothetical protein [Thioalkalivibrio sulfidiphilus]|uniref:hypothetical protein n=1 Tax=Thioalkalivibrio sulfidiphilus TaxID=1033854 RepID=UPI000370C225|nr:hypothetical protein [Thioalkalivibrio sulfidiphilus]